MTPKKSSINRFFTLLFTDKDTEEEDGVLESIDIENTPEEIFADFQTETQVPWEERERQAEDIFSTFAELIDPKVNEEIIIPETKSTFSKEKNISIKPEFTGPDTEDIRTQVLEPVSKKNKDTNQETIPDFLLAEESNNTTIGTIVQQEKPISKPKTEEIVKNSEGKIDKKMPEKKKEINPNTGTIILGLTKNGNEVVSLTTEALKRHMLVVGMTGSGKTTMIERMILQDIEAGRGVGLIDPHGDLYERILAQIPKSRSNDVVLFDLTDTEYPIGFNILENTHEQFPSLIASSIVGVFKKIFGYSWGPRLEYILRNATLTLLEKQGSTLLDLTLLLTDEDYRRSYVQKINNPFLKKFWSDEFENMSASKQNEVVSPILNKVGQFLSVPLIRNIVSQPQSGFSPRWVMDNKKIFLANLSKGKIGEDVSEMLGSLLVSKFQLDVMSRANIAPEKREQFTLFVDEFQNFATESFGDIFSEARKYGLGLVIAHQYLGQANTQLLDAIMGNVGNIAVFHVGASDAKTLAPNIGQGVEAHSLSEQQLYNFTLKTSTELGKKIFQGELLHPDMMSKPIGLQSPAKLQSLVRDKYAKERSFVESKLNTKMS